MNVIAQIVADNHRESSVCKGWRASKSPGCQQKPWMNRGKKLTRWRFRTRSVPLLCLMLYGFLILIKFGSVEPLCWNSRLPFTITIFRARRFINYPSLFGLFSPLYHSYCLNCSRFFSIPYLYLSEVLATNTVFNTSELTNWPSRDYEGPLLTRLCDVDTHILTR